MYSIPHFDVFILYVGSIQGAFESDTLAVDMDASDGPNDDTKLNILDG